MMVLDRPVIRERLWPWSLFAAMIAMAGLPIYIHAPKFFVDNYGVSLASLGVVLALLRLIDVVQDPLLGWLAESQQANRGGLVTVGVGVMVASMLALFAIQPPIAPLAWFALCLVGLFSSFSFLTIVFYAQGVSRAARLGNSGHVQLAGWRETGSLLGVSIAAMAPVALASLSGNPLTAFAVGFAVFALVAWAAMKNEWEGSSLLKTQTGDNQVDQMLTSIRDPILRRLLMIALVNGAPVAVTSTLFLFFVEARLGAPGWEGPLLLLYFLSAALAAPVWSLLARQMGEKSALIAAMALSIAAFIWAIQMGEGDLIPFAVVCVVTGFALGADLTLLPALFSRRLAGLDKGGEGASFGLWSFVSKLSLAFAALILLPTLDASGFVSGGVNGPDQLATLSILYAGIPCALKVLAFALLITTDLSEV